MLPRLLGAATISAIYFGICSNSRIYDEYKKQKLCISLKTRLKSSDWRSSHYSSLMSPSVPTHGWRRASTEALPKALRLVELTEEFLKQKDAERNAYWDTPEGKAEREARWAQIKARYEK